MAEEQKPVEVVQDAAAQVQDAAPALDTATPAETVEAAQDKAADTTDAAPAAVEDKKEEIKEVKPIEEGHLGHKTAGQSFPKNLLGSKDFFFFGSDALEAKALETYKKSQKGAETALNNIAWAAETGKGLLFAGDKKAPSHIINLAHATEPETEGANKFHLTANGNKHSFKAASAAERDNWVSQIKAKIAEAKELVSNVTESETYKQTLESFKPAAKGEKAAEAPKEEAAEEAKTEETPKEEGEAAKEEAKTEEPKRRSASRKRASFFGFGKKDLLPKEEAKTEEAAAPAVETATEDKAVDAAEAPAAAETAAATSEEAPAEAAAATEEAAEDKVETPKEKSSKRNSIFGNVFSKKEKKATETKAADATEATEEGAATEAAPVIPPVEENTPLADEINNASTEATEPVAEAKKDVKEKRKSSLPFAFGKRDKSPATASAAVTEGEEKAEKPASKSAFSKLRATIKGKGAAAATKAEEKGTEVAATAEETATETTETAQETATETAEKVQEAVNGAGVEAENKAENVASSTPAVTAAA